MRNEIFETNDDCGLIMRSIKGKANEHFFHPDLVNFVNVNETLKRRSQKRFRDAIHGDTTFNRADCLIGVTFVNKRQNVRMQHYALRVILNMIQPADFNVAVVIGDDIGKFRKGLRNIDRKFYYLETIGKLYSLHAFCPNCTNSWLKPQRGWVFKDGQFVNITSGRKLESCCDPLKGKSLRVSHGEVVPLVFM